jgi:HD-GYP domain-containing protein (c-di-GMP phosphodiesterase class II)
MLKEIKAADLKIGMHVILPLAWHKHPFLKNHFLISSRKEIDQIRQLGVKSLKIDLSKSRVLADPPVPEEPKPEKTQETHQLIVPDELRAAIHNKNIPPAEKARLVQQHSITMMSNLLANPTTDTIRQAKQGITEVVDMILTDDETTFQLLKITSHDYYTYTHSVSVGVLAVSLAKEYFRHSSGHDMHALGAGFFLHDLGKVQINNEIINKPGKLTEEEMQEMRRHPAIGFKILNETHQLTGEAKTIVLQHHERHDGKGYPQGLRGSEIHIYGRICAIADVYDALTADRSYKKKMAPFDALKLMGEEMRDHFHEGLFEQFVVMFKER